MRTVMYALASVAALFGAAMIYSAMTVPAFASGGPAILGVAALAAAFLIFRSARKRRAA